MQIFVSIITQKIEGMELILAKKKIILPERKIIVEKLICISLSQYQPDVDANMVEILL
jgi:hypothetical protein